MAGDTTRTSDERELTLEAGGGAAAIEAGATLGRYQIVAPIGAGGMGVVYRARDPALDRDLAIKVVPTARGGDGQARLLREAQAMARLRRNGVVPVFDVGVVGDGIFVVMPFLPGGTLGGWLAAAPRAWREVLDRFTAAGRGLAVAHAAGLVHRDFKPDNVLIDEHGEVAVADFGLARTAGETAQAGARGAPTSDAITHAGSIVGTPAYMPPEQLRGEPVDARADVFAFCASLYEGLYGERAFAATHADARDRIAALLDAIVARRIRQPPPGARVPAWLRAAVLRGLAADPADRWPSIDALLAHLARRRRRPRRIAVAIAAVVLAGGAATAIAVATRGAATSPPAPASHTTTRLTTTGDIGRATVSPDGRRIAAVAGTDLVVFDVDHPESRRTLAHDVVLDNPDTFRPAWSPDSREIAYPLHDAPGYFEWHAITPDGADRVLAGQHAGFGFARDGAFVTFQQPGRALVVTDARGHASAPCTIDGAYKWMVRVQASPINDDVFVVTLDADFTDPYQIYRTDLRCSRVERIVAHAQLRTIAPSADGDGFVATATVGDGVDVLSIDRDGGIRALGLPIRRGDFVAGARADGGVIVVQGVGAWRLLRLDRAGHASEVTGAANDVALALSPDGRRLAIDDYTDHGIVRVTELAHPDAPGPPIARDGVALDWSPDGDRLAVITASGVVVHLVVMDADGAHRDERTIDDASASSEIMVRWISADQIAYELAGNVGFSVLDLRTGQRRDFADRHAGWMFALHRSPSGALAWVLNHDSGGSIWYAPRDGAPARQLVAEDDDLVPVWRGEELLLYSASSPDIERVDLASGKRTPFVSLPLGHGEANGEVFALPDGDLLVERATSITDLALITRDRGGPP